MSSFKVKYNTTFLTLLNLWIKNWTCFLELIIYRCSKCIYGLRCEGFIWNKCPQGPQCGRVLLAMDRLLEDAWLEKGPHPFATFLVFAVQHKVKFVTTVNSFQQTKLWQWLFLDHDEYMSVGWSLLFRCRANMKGWGRTSSSIFFVFYAEMLVISC